MILEKRIRILVVDDEPQILEDILTFWGYEVETATDGFSGLQRLMADTAFDLVILDVSMPRMDGWAVLTAIRKEKALADLPVMMLTSHDTEDDLIRGLRRGADEYLTKPISPRKLLAYVEAVYKRSQRSRLAPPQAHPASRGSAAASQGNLLTPREREILQALSDGASNQQIADRLSITETTVKNHLAHVYKKLNVENRTQAAFLAQRLNLV